MKIPLLFIGVAILLFSCSSTLPEKKPLAEVAPLSLVEKLPPPEQDLRAQKVFEEILEMTLEEERSDVLPKMEVAYLKIINEYPDSSFAEESYMRLIILNLNDYIPPRIEEAERLYQEFLRKYPLSFQKFAIGDTIVRFYYRQQLWQKLLEFTTPEVKTYIETGKLRGPFFLFLYSEALFNLNELFEAEKGYKIIRELFPSSAEAVISNDRLKEIGLKKR